MTRPTPPTARKEPTTHRLHGEERPDDYHWLKTRGREDPAVVDYLQSENAYLSAVLAPHAELQAELYRELRGHLQEEDAQPPVRIGEWEYLTRTEEGKEHPIFARRRPGKDEEELLLDLNALKAREGHENLWVYGAAPSEDGRYWAYLLDTSGQEVFELRILDTESGELAEAPLTGVSGWVLDWGAGDGGTGNGAAGNGAAGYWLYYATDDATQRPEKIWQHRLGGPQNSDRLLHTENDPTFRASAALSEHGQTLLLGSFANRASEWYALDAGDPAAAPRLLLPRERGVEVTDLTDAGGHWLALTNHGGAEEFKLLRFAGDTLPLRWADAEELLPHDPERHLEGFQLFAGHLLVSGRRGGISRLWVLPRDGEGGYGAAREVAFPEDAYTVDIGENHVFDTTTARVLYTSLVTPLQHLDLDLNTLDSALVKQTPVPGYDPADYTSERRWVVAGDGERIPVSVVRRRDTALPAPTLLYGYGSYGYGMDPSFSMLRLPLLDRGFVWAVAHIRGGNELGRRWYDAGRLGNKMNTFTDFVAAAEGLRAQEVASDIVAMGRSAGGLLVGAALNLRPELFAAAFVGVPFVDVLSTMLDDALPLTTGEYDEWGNPVDAGAYATMRGYSPYDNLRPEVYPHLFVSGGLNDPRVAYWEPAKYVARLRTLLQPGSGTVVLKTLMGAGHGGSSSRFARLEEAAEEYAFALAAVRGELPRHGEGETG